MCTACNRFYLFCYERDLIIFFSYYNQADVIEIFSSISRYIDDLLNIDNPYLEGMVNQMYPREVQLNKTNAS